MSQPQRAANWVGSAAYATGVAGEAFQFDGTSKVRITEAAAIDLSRTNRWTVTAWVKPATVDGAEAPMVYSEGNRVAALGLQKGTGKLVSWINGGNLLESTAAVPANAWTHVALVFDRGTRTLYLNGAAAGTAAGTPATTPDSGNSAIGGVPADDASAAFTGAIDEVTVHRRVLSADEIGAIHAAGSTGLCFGEGGPAWVIQPQPPETVPIFGNVTLTGLAMGSPRPTYQWYFNDAPMAGQTGFTLELSNVTSAQAGKYALVATSGTQSIRAEVLLDVQHCVDPPPGLVAWWPADGNALEFTGHHSGEVWNGVAFPEGIAGQAFQFDGTKAYVAVPDASALSPHAGAMGEMSVEAWVKLPAMPLPDPVGPQDRRRVLTKGDPDRWEYTLSITTTGVPEFIVTSPAGEWYASVAAGQLLTDTWHHLVGVLKKGAYLRLYQDGNLMGESTAFTGDTADTGSPLYIGSSGAGGFLDGLIDEPAIYSRALTEEEIQALYAGGSVGKCYGGGPKPVFVQEPQDAEGYLLNSVTFEGLALGTPRPVYQWYGPGGLVEGEMNSALTLSKLSPADGGEYHLVASNQFGATQSRVLTLTTIDWAAVPHDFENGWDGCSTDDYSIWQVGRPSSGPGAAHSGANCAATVLGGDYPDDRQSRLVSPAFEVPAASERPRLRFWHWWSFNAGDIGQVQISTNNGASWQALSGYYGHASYYAGGGTPDIYDSFGRWSQGWFDLGTYAGRTVLLGFYFESRGGGNNPGLGWYIDDLKVEVGPSAPFPLPEQPEGFEGGWGGWQADYAGGRATDFALWEIGRPTSGPGAAHGEANCAATVLGGNYPDDRQSRLVSPAFEVPAASERPRLRFWHWWSFNAGDIGQVQISTNNGASWQALSGYYGHASYYTGGGTPDIYDSFGRWSQGWFDLGTYAGRTVLLGFYFESRGGGNNPSLGWYIDDLRIEVGSPPPFPLPEQPEGFEDGWGGWQADYAGGRATDFALWEIGRPSSGPGAAHSGTSCAATVLGGNYPDDRQSRLVSPALTVPAASQNPRLRFWHWWSFNAGDIGQVQISTNNGASWQALSGYYGHASYYAGGDTPDIYDSFGRWSQGWLDLGTYAGKTVLLGFYFESRGGGNNPSLGWYIDDLRIEVGSPPPFPLPEQPEGFEDGWGGWQADYAGGRATDFALWEIGRPSSGPGAAHSGTSCAATVLGGNYPDDRQSRLVSPAFTVPAASQNPRLRFWHWWSFNAGDIGQVQISTNNGASWQALSARYGHSSYYGSGGGPDVFDSGGQWLPASLELAEYVGKTVRLGFYFQSAGGGNNPDLGWYVDDLMIQVGNIGLAEVPSQTVNEKTPVSFKANAVGADANSSLVFTLPWAPEGAWIDPESGDFTWLPGERQGPGVYRIPVYLVDYGNGEANEMTTVTITVHEVNERPWLLPDVLAVEPGQTLHLPLFAGDRDYPKNPLKFTMTGAPAGLTLTTNTGILHWEVPGNAPAATYRLGVTLSDNGSPNYTTNNTIALTVTTHATYGLSVRHMGGADFEFTIHDATATEDYILERATAIVDPVTWMPNGDNIPAWVATLPEEDYLEWLTWEEFVQAKLHRTEWVDVARISPARMPHSFVVTVTDIADEPFGFFRVVRVQR